MSVRQTRNAVAGAALSALLCVAAAGPAAADTSPVPSSWESAALSLPAAQSISKGAGVTVAVLDSGVSPDHPALKGKVISGPDLLDDGLGTSDPGWGVHGTAMASDVLKVAPEARILSVRIIDESKAVSGKFDRSPTQISEGIKYAVTHGANVISMSLGSVFASYNYSDTEAIGYAVSHGVSIVASAGNSASEGNDGGFPAGYASVISVAATQQSGSRASFSTVRTHNAVAAPGVDILSAARTGGYRKISGTSPAGALAAGVVALMHAHNPKLTPAQVRSILTSTAHHPAGGHNALVGYGQINAAAAVQAAGSPPADRAAVVPYKGKEHLATPDGAPKTSHAEMEQGIWWGGLGAAGVGLLMLAVGLVMVLLRRRRAAAAGMAPPPNGIPVQPGYPAQAQAPNPYASQQPPYQG